MAASQGLSFCMRAASVRLTPELVLGRSRRRHCSLAKKIDREAEQNLDHSHSSVAGSLLGRPGSTDLITDTEHDRPARHCRRSGRRRH